MTTTGRQEKPYPFRLKELKAPLQKHAVDIDRSLAWIIRTSLKLYMKKNKIKFKETK